MRFTCVAVVVALAACQDTRQAIPEPETLEDPARFEPPDDRPGAPDPVADPAEDPAVDPGENPADDPPVDDPPVDDPPVDDPPVDDPPVDDPPVDDPPVDDPTDPPPALAACGEVELAHSAPSAGQVLVAGDFDGWTGTPMADDDDDGDWSIVLTLDPGSYPYKFVVDGEWLVDPNNPQTADDGFGGQNSVLTVPDCDAKGALQLVSHATVGGTFEAVFATVGGGIADPESIGVTVDWEPGPSLAPAEGGGVLVINGLSDGIHDVRVTHAGGTTLLKVYVGLEPDWRDATIYFAMTDRFSNGDPANDAPVDGVDWRTNYQGGDFRGVIDRLQDGYFEELGVGALWLSWPVDNLDGAEDGGYPAHTGCGLNPSQIQYSPVKYTAYHGYWPSDLGSVEEHFGTLEELRELVVEAHARGIRVLLDFTANHVHVSSPFFDAHVDEGWFNTPAQICQDVGWDTAPKTCWFTGYLPDLNYTNPQARKAVIEHALEQVHETGADGFRFDAVKHLEMSFVQDLRAATEAAFEQTDVPFYIVGETFTGDAGLIQSFVGDDRIHGQFDFPSNMAILKGLATQELGLDAMDTQIRGIKAVYGGGELMSTFVGNHDIARFVSLAAGQIPCGIWDVVSNIAQGWHAPPDTPWDEAPFRQLQLALTYAMTIPGIPLIYYGDEVGLAGAGDPDNRRMMPFGADLSAHQQSTLDFVRALGQARQASIALRRGSWSEPLWAEPGFLAFGRHAGNETAIVLLNREDGSRSGSLNVTSLGLADGTVLTDLLSGAQATVQSGHLPFDQPWKSAAIFVTN